jgi:hypothetical protein
MLSTTLTSGSWDQATETWTLQISKRGEKSTITSSNVVFAVGVGSQVPVKPVYPNEVRMPSTGSKGRSWVRALAKLRRQHSKAQHSTLWSIRIRNRGKGSTVLLWALRILVSEKVKVVLCRGGQLTQSTAHDVAEDMLEAGLASVTMVQRTPTCKDLRPSILDIC